MKKVIISIIGTLMLFFSLCVYADTTITQARSYWLYETGTGKILAEYQSDLVTPAASLTKLMTFLLIMESIDKGSLQWDEIIRMPESYVNPGDSSMDLTPGQRVTVRQLVNGLMIVSANDAAKVLAARLGGSEDVFVKRMNIRAEELGMKHTFFVNATGLPLEGGQNRTSAADIGLLSDYLLKTYPDLLLAITGQSGLYNPETNSSKPATNTLMLLKKGVDGLKTGHTDEAGYCIAASMPFTSRQDARLIAVVMGTPSEKARDEAAKKLLDWAEKNYAFKNVIDEKTIITAGYWKGLASRPVLGHSDQSVERLVKADGSISVETTLAQPQKLPLRKGDTIGAITALLPDGERITASLLSDTEISDLTLPERFMAFLNDVGAWIASFMPS